jgi:GT2 family glycosyltransferase
VAVPIIPATSDDRLEPTRLPTVSAVIVTYNRRSQLAEVIRAVGRDDSVCEIVVVVDGCHDGSYELAIALARSDARIRVIWQENAGDSAARQAGTRAATGDVVLMLDDDVIAGPGLAEGHARHHMRTPNAVVLGYMPVDLVRPRRPGSFATYLYADEYERQCAQYERDPSEILRHLWAGNLSISRADALRVGFLSEGEHLAYHGDQAFGLRCLRASLVGVFDRRLTALHRHERDMDAFVRQSRIRGSDRRIIEQSYPELTSVSELHDPLPFLIRAAIALASAPGLGQLTTKALRWHTRLAGDAHLWRLENALARCMRQIELRRGYRATATG